jgi:hypothetical protein
MVGYTWGIPGVYRVWTWRSLRLAQLAHAAGYEAAIGGVYLRYTWCVRCACGAIAWYNAWYVGVGQVIPARGGNGIRFRWIGEPDVEVIPARGGKR